MKRVTIGLIVLGTVCGTVCADAVQVTHRRLQAVDAEGNSRFADPGAAIRVEGILLNCPEQWLDPTPDPTVAPWYMGGQWQVFVQGEGDDHAGTACWMGQNYANGPGDESYTNDEWLGELARLNHDPNTGYVFRPGDRVRVIGHFLPYGGKVNINEAHSTDPDLDFRIELVKPAAGLPQPEPIHLSDLKDDRDAVIFDADRLSGPEYYQGCLVRLEDVTIEDPNAWGPGQTVTVTDGRGRTFPLALCLGTGFSRHACPAGRIDVIGIVNQEASGWPQDLRTGYSLLVMDYDGNGLVLGTMTQQRGNLPGDVNGDYRVDDEDMDELMDHWLDSVPGLAQ